LNSGSRADAARSPAAPQHRGYNAAARLAHDAARCAAAKRPWDCGLARPAKHAHARQRLRDSGPEQEAISSMNAAVEPALPAGPPLAGRSEAGAARRLVAGWLLLCCALVAAMVVLGGVTRLTGSGLSMVTWKPLHGVVPPLNQAEWAEEFDRYRASPEYRLKNAGMSLDGFKRIFWFEYAHRLLGRAVGVAFLLPMLWLLARRLLDPRLVPRLALMFVLGGAQGLLGWWMVKSGLVAEPRVSQYRLTAHLGLAIALYLWMLWTALAVLRGRAPVRAARAPLARPALALLLFAFVTVLSGGFVAGLHAGLIYNTFPSMGGHWLPPDLWALTPGWRNPFENAVTAQFGHRVLATVLFAAVLALCAACLRAPVAGPACAWAYAAAAAIVLQFALGVATLLAQAPVPLAAAHQANALLVLSALTGLAFSLRR
jgi:cytochrome c oxidase assembly protein subunit 15